MTERIIALAYGLIGSLLIFCMGPWGGVIGSTAWPDDQSSSGVVAVLAIVFLVTTMVGAGLAMSQPMWSGRIMAASGIAIFFLFDFSAPAVICAGLLTGAAITIDRTIPRLIGLTLRYGVAKPVGAVFGLFRGQGAPAAS